MFSQKIAAIRVVPWYDSEEWRSVFRQIYTESDDIMQSRQVALDYMKMWQHKTDILPAGIQATMVILEAMLSEDTKAKDQQRIQQIIYSMSLMKFVNLMVDSTDKTSTMFRAAKRMKIPDWIIGLRHDIAHNTNLPPITVLRTAIDFALKWLYEEYWFPENELIVDYVINDETVTESLKESLSNIMLFYSKVVTVMEISGKRIRIQAIESNDIKKDILIEIKRLLKEQVTVIDKKTSIKDLEKCILYNIEEIMLNNKGLPSRYEILVDVLLQDNIFLNEALLEKNKQYETYVAFWNKLICYLDSVNALSIFMKRLMIINCNDGVSEKQRTIAGKWIQYISRAVARSKTAKKLLEMNIGNKSYSIKEALQEVEVIQCEIPTPIKLTPRSEMDLFFTGSRAIQYFMTQTQGIPYGKYWLNVLFMIDQMFDQVRINQIVEIQEMMEGNIKATANGLSKDNEEAIDEEDFFTVEDINKIKRAINKNKDECMEVSDNNDMWSEVPEHYDWSSCPIGRLPWQ